MRLYKGTVIPWPAHVIDGQAWAHGRILGAAREHWIPWSSHGMTVACRNDDGIPGDDDIQGDGGIPE